MRIAIRESAIYVNSASFGNNNTSFQVGDVNESNSVYKFKRR